MVRERTEASAIRNLVSPASLTPKGFATTERDRMRALTVEPGRAHSACVEDVPEPGREDGAVLVRTLSVGIRGTDADIVAGESGWAPPGRRRLTPGPVYVRSAGPTEGKGW